MTKVRPWLPLIGIGVFAVLLLLVVPATLSMHWINNLGKYCCLAMAAVGIGLAWGRGGMLVLGQGVFFGLGAYCMAMHLTLETAGPGRLPTFMILYDPLGDLPAFWEPFRSELFTLLAIAFLPAIVASVLGYALFKRRVKGAYFAILSQALAVALAVLISSTIRETGGDTGLSDFKYFFGFTLSDDTNKLMVYAIAASLLIVCLLVAWQLRRSRLGELLVATRDAEERVRFLGYDPADVKLVAYVVAAVMAGVGGAMFVPIVGIITPAELGASASILMIAGVALGGRASLFGPALGAIAVGWGQSSLGSTWPGGWVYVLGLLFILVTLFIPGGLASVFSRVWSVRRRPRPAPVAVPEVVLR
ncbi:urea ABC transporter permease subunit UrtC [Cellulomonas sp. URHD0024]|uniref:urea ABC transporter permease subunit UrtC n=1 Tax=Cellulomonas sp. URHD0024 TaxID=1302620 RepID=UPI00040D16E3|nr:urea ABC transporter permease subunit UrtC [Cellulomonas sp. URHD0024]